ncbi:MAG: EAL domain-containing protein [Bacteroidales bacterium]|nr:EAL domain-containing protein [Bacteroidales bacterium]MCM1415635.1 EAL domain-containing protein [bacterium]MCM1422955.1 EAL domain-containing protein [bacterium]
MNIYAQVCGMILLVVMIAFYTRYKSLRLGTQIAFQALMTGMLLCIFFDMFSIWAIVHLMRDHLTLVYAICKIYLMTIVLVALLGFLYECADVYAGQKRFWTVTYIGCAFFLAESTVIACLPIGVYKMAGVVYSAGPAVLVTYAFAGSFLISNAIFTIRNQKLGNPRRTQVILIWMGMWVAAAVVQFLNNDLLLVGYAGALGVLVIFFRLENPEYLTDRVTGLYNHDALLFYARKLYGGGKKFAVMSVWWSLGLGQADENQREEVAMRAFAKRLPKFERTKVFKMADDEVWLVFETPEDAERHLEKIRSFVEYGRKEIGGIAQTEYTYLPDTTLVRDHQEMVQLMQYARWKSRDHGTANFKRVDSEFVEQMRQEKRMEQMLEDAMQENRIEVFYQPIYSTRQKKFVSAEALVRMRDREGHLVPPGAFISVAEANGKILPLGEIVFDKVCRFFTAERLEQYGLHYIEVNLSVIQCGYSELADDYIAIMEKYQIDPKHINLEITESASMAAKKTLLENMRRLMEYGVYFSLDDFGTGQSNLNYIVDMPVNIVKFDREMSQAFFRDEKAKYVMNAAMQMIHGMKLKIVSEGIETKEQYLAMEELDIDYIQGYYFSKPLPEREFLTFLQENQESAG